MGKLLEDGAMWTAIFVAIFVGFCWMVNGA